jgi:hypothetical protein
MYNQRTIPISKEARDMLHFHDQGPTPRADEDDDDDDDHGSSVRAPQVDSGKGERLNPPTEYKVVDLSGAGANLEAKLNELGEEGWALVATTPSFIFRRMKKTEEAKKKARVGFGIG